MSRLFKTILISAIIALIGVTEASAQRYWQRIDLSVNVGYATFKMDDLKAVQEEDLSYMPVEGKITNSFPGYLNFGIDAVFYDSTYFVGVLLGHTSTGGRVHYADYSGSITMDQLVKMDYNGLVGAYRIASTNAGNIFIGTNLLTYLNKVEFIYSQTLFEQSSTSGFNLQSLNFAVGPFVQIHKRLGKFLVKGNVGYEFHFGMDLFYDDPDQKYISSSGYVKVNADGFRAGVGVGYAVYTRRPKSK